MEDEWVEDVDAAGQHQEVAAVEKPAQPTKPGMKFVPQKTSADQHLAKREATLLAILKRSFKSRVIIFANEKAQCNRLMALLTMYGFKAAEVHSNKTQAERLKAIELF